MDNLEDNIDEVVETSDNTEASETEVQPKKEYIKTPHDHFDWSKGKSGNVQYSADDFNTNLAQYVETLNSIKEFEIVPGKVIAVIGGDVVLDLNCKSDGLVSTSEFRDNPNLKVGDSVEVYVETQEDKRGQLVLSRRKAKLLRAWENIVNSFE